MKYVATVGVITHSKTQITYSGIGNKGRFSGSWPLKDTTNQASMARILEIFASHGVTEYEEIPEWDERFRESEGS